MGTDEVDLGVGDGEVVGNGLGVMVGKGLVEGIAVGTGVGTIMELLLFTSGPPPIPYCCCRSLLVLAARIKSLANQPTIKKIGIIKSAVHHELSSRLRSTTSRS